MSELFVKVISWKNAYTLQLFYGGNYKCIPTFYKAHKEIAWRQKEKVTLKKSSAIREWQQKRELKRFCTHIQHPHQVKFLVYNWKDTKLQNHTLKTNELEYNQSTTWLLQNRITKRCSSVPFSSFCMYLTFECYIISLLASVLCYVCMTVFLCSSEKRRAQVWIIFTPGGTTVIFLWFLWQYTNYSIYTYLIQ